MRNIGGFEFPDIGEATEWKPFTQLVPLHTNVLCVAQTRIEGEWSAYIAPVPGMDHSKEFVQVLRHGTKLQPDVAKAIFPRFADVPYHI